MAIYHLSAKVISRAGGRSSVAAAAYRSGGRLRDNRQGMEHDYSRKGGVVHTEIMAPGTAPDWMRDRDQLWNAVEAVERRRDAQLAREIEIALPRELDRGARLDLLRGFVQRAFVDRGMVADVAVHEGKARDGHGQPHAHVMLTMRALTGEGFGKKDRSWNAPDLLMSWRAAWARDANAALERAGRSERIDHRSLHEQRAEAQREVEQARDTGQNELALERERKAVELDREPEPKIGPAANALEKRGIATERGAEFRAAQARNARRQELGWRQLELRVELMERGRMFIAAARAHLDQIWQRAGDAMQQIRERVARGAGRELRDDGAGGLEGRREAVLEREAAERDDKTRAPAGSPDQTRRDAVLGRHRPSGQTRSTGRNPDRER